MKELRIQDQLDQIQESLKQLKSQTKEILNPDEASDFLSIRKSYLYKLTSSNKITYFRPEGKLIYFRKTDLEKFLLRNQQPSQEDFEDEIQRHWK